MRRSLNIPDVLFDRAASIYAKEVQVHARQAIWSHHLYAGTTCDADAAYTCCMYADVVNEVHS